MQQNSFRSSFPGIFCVINDPKWIYSIYGDKVSTRELPLIVKEFVTAESRLL